MTVDTQNYSAYCDQFQYTGGRIYELIYERNRHHIRTKRRAVALVNLQRIFEHTFAISKRDGFREMSLRQLSHESGISIGGIYACLESKQALAQMAHDCVTYIGLQHMQSTFVPCRAVGELRRFIRDSLYMTEAMHEWLRFLFVDVRRLSGEGDLQLARLGEVFVSGVARLRSVEANAEQPVSAPDAKQRLEARLALLLLGDWVQRREQLQQQGIGVDDYADYVVAALTRDLPSASSRSAGNGASAIEVISGVDVI